RPHAGPARAPQGPQAQQVPPPAPPQLAATVNGRDITEDEATRWAWTQLGRKILEGVIDDVLVRQAAAAAKITVTDAEVTARVASLAKQAGGTAKVIAERGVAGLDALRAQIRYELLLQKLVDRAGKVDEAKARAYYAAHRDDYITPTRLHLFEIVTEKDETAYQSRRRVAAGEAFAKIAGEVSQAPSAEKGGDLGWVTLDEINPPALRPIAATLTVGQVSMPILAEGKFYILMVADKKEGQVKSFEDVRDEIITKLREESGATPESVLLSLRRAAAIKIHAEPYKYLEEEYARLKQIGVVVAGKKLELAHPPVILPSGHMIVPAKPVFRALGCRVQWVAKTKTLVLSTKDKSVRIIVGSDKAQAKEGPVALGEKAQLREGTVWVPPRPVAQALGFEVRWNAQRYQLELGTPKE
ncbi:MAG: peptidyl-prolyl cis-trans isomerase, partial [Armatimonadetes bacterium]|nr:peptidyl-prolyl cis-trans isomerase [Armatimonadota bacterium]